MDDRRLAYATGATQKRGTCLRSIFEGRAPQVTVLKRGKNGMWIWCSFVSGFIAQEVADDGEYCQQTENRVLDAVQRWTRGLTRRKAELGGQTSIS